ncbi:hypothetical protein PQX77_013224 [Marasmius sp. AFHP31]|nr:hypothetical protein PQX77_013224 [Marasmius sp. AFHP31]
MGIASTLVVVRSALGIAINDEKSFKAFVLDEGENEATGGILNSIVDIGRRNDSIMAETEPPALGQSKGKDKQGEYIPNEAHRSSQSVWHGIDDCLREQIRRQARRSASLFKERKWPPSGTRVKGISKGESIIRRSGAIMLRRDVKDRVLWCVGLVEDGVGLPPYCKINMCRDMTFIVDELVCLGRFKRSLDHPMVATKSHLPTGARNLKAVHTSSKARSRNFQPRFRGRRNKTHEQRIQDLLNDPLVHKPSLGSFRVGCLACGQRLQLDRRGGRTFYASNWLKHRNGGCQKASEAQQKIDKGQSFEVAPFWKGWTRKHLNNEDRREDENDRSHQHGLYDPFWREQCIQLEIFDEYEATPLSSHASVVSQLTAQELEVARTLFNGKMSFLANVAAMHG